MSAITHNLSTEDDFIAGLNVSSLNKSLDAYAEKNRPAVCLPTTGEHTLTGVLPLLGFHEAYDRFLFRQFDRSDGGAEGVVDGVISSLSNIVIEGVSPNADGNDIKVEKDLREGGGVEGGVDGGKGGGEGGGSSDEDDEDWLDSQIG